MFCCITTSCERYVKNYIEASFCCPFSVTILRLPFDILKSYKIINLAIIRVHITKELIILAIKNEKNIPSPALKNVIISRFWEKVLYCVYIRKVTINVIIRNFAFNFLRLKFIRKNQNCTFDINRFFILRG